jgi:hypothetical protein
MVDLSPEDRRASRRRPLNDVPQIIEVRIDSGAVKVVDISKGGLCLQSNERLAPGRGIRLQIVSNKTTLSVRCHVVRCQVAGMSDGKLVYEAAAKFERPLPLVHDDEPIVVESCRVEPEEAPALIENNW